MKDMIHTYAAQEDGCARVKELLLQEVDVNTPHSLHQTKPIEFAAQSGSLRTVKYLIEVAKARLDASQAEHNLFGWALFNDNADRIIEYLADFDNIIYKQFNDGTNGFHAAAVSGQLDVVKNWLSLDPSCLGDKDSRGQTALYWAAAAGQFAVVHCILAHEAFKQLSDPDKFEPMLRGDAVRSYLLGRRFGALKKVDEENHHFNESMRCFEKLKHKRKGDYVLLANIYENFGNKRYAENKLEEKMRFVQLTIDCLEKSADTKPVILDSLTNSRRNLEMLKAELLRLKSFHDDHEKKRQSQSLRFQDDWKRLRSDQSLLKELTVCGFTSHDVIPDGNCFFRAVVHQLSIRKNPHRYAHMTHEYLRHVTTEHVKEYLDQYSGFIEDKTPEQYLEDLQEDHHWVDNIAISAFSRQFNFTVVIINSDGTPPLIFRRPHPRAILHLGYEVEVHYQSLVPCADMLPSQSIEEAIQRTEIDTFEHQTPEEEDLKRKQQHDSHSEEQQEGKKPANAVGSKVSETTQTFFATTSSQQASVISSSLDAGEVTARPRPL